ncbi:MAG: ComEC/Rec2 family competence protein [Candidatus Staskawiczbacteria bacterium]|nr:ComEC/Rec2 family competence protein [Candidatus Staskawiczbacteria bacterium]
MQKKYIVGFALFLFFLNILCWQEVFVLSGPRYLQVDFFDVGQGDSAFIRTPEGHNILIDGGPDQSVLARLNTVLPFWDKSLDLVILTHPEKDHMQGLLDVLQRYQVDYFLWTGVIKNDAENKKLADILKRLESSTQNSMLAALSPEKIKVITAVAGQEIKAGNVLIDTLYPLEDVSGKELKNTSNDTCVVSRLIYGKISFLFTGDISSTAEKDLVSDGFNLQSDVLKVAHHGSKYSTSDIFLAAVEPKMAVISVGAKNTYGHPTPETLQRLEKFGIKIFRTDKDGDVNFISDGKNIKVIK